MPHLLITRTPGESFEVDGPATIVIHRVRGDKVKIGVWADESVSIMRSELLHPEAVEAAGGDDGVSDV